MGMFYLLDKVEKVIYEKSSCAMLYISLSNVNDPFSDLVQIFTFLCLLLAL